MQGLRRPFAGPALFRASVSALARRQTRAATQSKSQIQTCLNNWISDYVVGDPNASHSMKAKRPLQEAQIEVHSQC